MNISFVLAVLNNLELTKGCYNHIRSIYPDTPLVITSAGSTDGTHEWLDSLSDPNLIYRYTEERQCFSKNYNMGIELVQTDKLVLIHNDMVIGEQFLENIEQHLEEDMILSYTTIEPPIFADHSRPGKVISSMGSNFEDFNDYKFNEYVKENKDKHIITDGAVFFMSGYKKSFIDVGMFDGDNFFPAFCEDDDILLRFFLKGYKLKTLSSSITYHFVSQTSRFSEEYQSKRFIYELNSNRNFIRKWGTPSSVLNDIKYWTHPNFEMKKFTMSYYTTDLLELYNIEPYFDKIDFGVDPVDYYSVEQENTHFDLKSKFEDVNDCDVNVYRNGEMTNDDIMKLNILRLIIPNYPVGQYKIGNFLVDIKRSI